MPIRFRLITLIISALGIGSLAFSAAPVEAYQVVDPIFAASDFATGFNSCPNPGPQCTAPAALAWSPSGKLYVGDTNSANGNVYVFGAGGGAAGPSTFAFSSPIPSNCGSLGDLLFSSTGRLYMVTPYLSGCGAGQVDEINPATGAEIRTVVSSTQLKGAANLWEDPLSHDLFLSTYDGMLSIFRIHNPESGSPMLTTYTSGFAGSPDGIAFGPDGTLYAVDIKKSANINRVYAIAGTNSPNAGQKVQIADTGPGSGPDGLAVGHGALLVNRNDGTITKIDLTKPGFPQSPILTGGSRGDFAILGGDGCFYASQTDRVIRLSNSDGSCVLNIPSNNFTIEPRVSCSGICHVILVKITFNSVGEVTAEQALPGQLLVARSAVASKKKKTKALIKKLTQAVSKGTNTLQLTLTAPAQKTLKKKGKLHISVLFTFTPTGGTAKSQVQSFTVKLPKKKKHH